MTDSIFDILGIDGGISLVDVQALGFKAAPAGQYIVKLIEIEGKKTKSGAPMLVCVFEIIEDLDGDIEYAGTRIWHNFTLSPEVVNEVAPIQFFKTWIECVGIEVEVIDAELIQMLIDEQPETGANVIQDEYEGTIRNKIKYFSKVS